MLFNFQWDIWENQKLNRIQEISLSSKNLHPVLLVFFILIVLNYNICDLALKLKTLSPWQFHKYNYFACSILGRGATSQKWESSPRLLYVFQQRMIQHFCQPDLTQKYDCFPVSEKHTKMIRYITWNPWHVGYCLLQNGNNVSFAKRRNYDFYEGLPVGFWCFICGTCTCIRNCVCVVYNTVYTYVFFRVWIIYSYTQNVQFV